MKESKHEMLKAQWKKLIKEQSESDLSIREWCRQNTAYAGPMLGGILLMPCPKSGSPEGAHASACVYSLVETAKANGLSPYKYLEFLLSRLPGSNFRSNPNILNLMMPWDELVQKTCKVD